MFASYERRVLEGDRSTTILHNFIAGIVFEHSKNRSLRTTHIVQGHVKTFLSNKIKVLESCEMHSATEIARRKQIVKDFHELKTEIMGLLEMNPVQIEMLDTQTIIQVTVYNILYTVNSIRYTALLCQLKAKQNC